MGELYPSPFMRTFFLPVHVLAFDVLLHAYRNQSAWKTKFRTGCSGGAKPGPAGVRAPAEKGCAPADASLAKININSKST